MATALEIDDAKEEGITELTERELAIIDGQDPDDPTEEAEADSGTPEPEAKEEPEPQRELPPEDEPEPEPEVSEEPDWVSDEVRSLAYSYGMTEKDLESFDDQADFERTGRILDQRLTQQVEVPQQEEAKFSLAEWEDYQRQQQASSPPAPEASGEAIKTDPSTGKLDPNYYRENDYDDETIRIVETASKNEQRLEQVESYLAEQRERESQAQVQSELNQFHRAVDTYKPDFFGETVSKEGANVRLSSENQEKRNRLYGEVAKIAQGLTMTGQSIPSYDVLVRRAGGVAFAEDFAKEQQDAYAGRIQKQSRRRRPVSGKAGSTGGGSPKPMSIDDIVADPEIESFWKRAQQENGVDY